MIAAILEITGAACWLCALGWGAALAWSAWRSRRGPRVIPHQPYRIIGNGRRWCTQHEVQWVRGVNAGVVAEWCDVCRDEYWTQQIASARPRAPEPR